MSWIGSPVGINAENQPRHCGKVDRKTIAPNRNPMIKVVSDAAEVPRRQKIPQMKTVLIGGASTAIMALMPLKIPPNLSP